MDSNDSALRKPGTFRLSWHSLRDAIVALPKIFLRVGPALVVLQLVQSGATQGIDFAVEKFQLMGREDLLLLALVAGVQMIFTLIWSAIWVITVTSAAARVFDRTEDSPGFGNLIAQHLNQLMIEEVRAIAAVVWRLPLLIVPSLIEYVRLALVPFVVIFDEDYGKGRIDALQASRKLVKGKFLLLAFAMMFFMALPWGMEKWIQGEAGPWIWENPVRVSAGIAASLVINVLASVFMYAVYRGLTQPAGLAALVQPSS